MIACARCQCRCRDIVCSPPLQRVGRVDDLVVEWIPWGGVGESLSCIMGELHQICTIYYGQNTYFKKDVKSLKTSGMS